MLVVYQALQGLSEATSPQQDTDLKRPVSPFVPHEFGQSEEEQEGSCDSTRDSDYAADGDDADSIIGEDMYQPNKMKELRRKMPSPPIDAQESINQDALQLSRYLAVDPTRVYKLDDLNDQDILHRAYTLLFQAKRGEEVPRLKLTPHINYKALPQVFTKVIEKKLKAERQAVVKARAIMKDPTARYVVSALETF